MKKKKGKNSLELLGIFVEIFGVFLGLFLAFQLENWDEFR